MLGPDNEKARTRERGKQWETGFGFSTMLIKNNLNVGVRAVLCCYSILSTGMPPLPLRQCVQSCRKVSKLFCYRGGILLSECNAPTTTDPHIVSITLLCLESFH
jgi:hypothetical protein